MCGGLVHNPCFAVPVPRPEAFDLPDARVEKAFKTLQKFVHPDKFGNRTEVRNRCRSTVVLIVFMLAIDGLGIAARARVFVTTINRIESSI